MTDHMPAPARQPIEERLKQVMSGRIHIGGMAEEALSQHNKTVCIMQATAYILGYDPYGGNPITDTPACTSAFIISLMITANDDESHGDEDKMRKDLRRAIPHIINTAPHYVTPQGKAVRLSRDPAYKEAEKQRLAMLRAKAYEWVNMEKERATRSYLYPEDRLGHGTAINWIVAYRPNRKALVDFVIELANVAHFGQQPEPVQA